MTLRLHSTRLFLATAATAFCLLGGSSAHAQFQVAIQLDKTNYLSQEAMIAVVTVTNRSGADVVLGGARGTRWLTFNMKDSTDRSLTPLDLTTEEPIVLEAGASTRRRVVLSETHSVQDPGTYSVTASVFHPASGDYYQSNRARFVVTDVKPFGQPIVFGVPEGFPQAGRVRRYVLMVNRDSDHSYLYFRLVDDSTSSKLTTYSLGLITLVREPQITMDRKNQLHVMFMTSRDVYIHAIMLPDGKLKSREFIRESQTSRPQLYLTASNDVVLRGGALFDPTKQAEEEIRNKGRGISERPPGL